MESIPLSVTIPVGPKPHHKQWLGECLESIFSQTVLPKEIFIVDDQAHLEIDKIFPCHWTGSRKNKDWYDYNNYIHISHYKIPWLAGVTHAFNCGVALADYEWVAMIGSDDTYYPNAIERAWKAIQEVNDPYGWFNFSCHLSDEDRVIDWFNHAAVVSKSLWKLTGGLHPMTVTGGMDAALLSIMMVHMPEHMHKIDPGLALYWVREHENNYTKESASRYGDFMVQLRNDLTNEWKEPDWT